MATPIAEQIHRHFVRLEEERAKAEGRKPRPVPVPWTRPHEQALCQEPVFLDAVKEYDYDLEDEAFQAYCRSRAVLSGAGVRGSTRWRFFAGFSRSKDEYLAEPDFQFAQEHEGRRYKYTPAELEAGWRVIVTGRGALQDCWELYRRSESSSRRVEGA